MANENLKGTKTEQNLLAAFQGESMARNKYTYYAEFARANGDPEIAALFDRMGLNECTHAKIWHDFIFGEVSSTVETLRNAAHAEFFEWSDMYPNFAQEARAEGFEEIASMFEKIANIEKAHEQQFMEAVVNLAKKRKEAKALQEELKIKAETEGVKKAVWRCAMCGNIAEENSSICPVCKAADTYEKCEIVEYM